MERMLIASGFVVLAQGDAITAIGFFYGFTHHFRNLKNAMPNFIRKIINIFKVLVRDDDDMPFVSLYPKGVEPHAHKVIAKNSVCLLEESGLTFDTIIPQANGASVAILSIQHTNGITYSGCFQKWSHFLYGFCEYYAQGDIHLQRDRILPLFVIDLFLAHI